MTHPAYVEVSGGHAMDAVIRTRFRHLVVHLSECGRHLVGEGTSNDHHVGLTRTCSEHNAQAILVVSRRGHVHHLYSAARKACSGIFQ